MEPLMRNELSEELTEFLLLKIAELSAEGKASVKTFLSAPIFRTEGDTSVSDTRLQLFDKASTCEVVR